MDGNDWRKVGALPQLGASRKIEEQEHLGPRGEPGPSESRAHPHGRRRRSYKRRQLLRSRGRQRPKRPSEAIVSRFRSSAAEHVRKTLIQQPITYELEYTRPSNRGSDKEDFQYVTVTYGNGMKYPELFLQLQSVA